MKVVSDTGPVLHLQEADLLSLLAEMDEVRIPPAVAMELDRWLPAPGRRELKWLQVQGLSIGGANQALRWERSGLLDRGEAEAIALTDRSHTDWLLTDDSAARWFAQSQGLEVHGSLGVLLWAAATERLEPAEAYDGLTRLASSTLWIAPKVLVTAQAALDELFK